jgi:hypothetical protein
MFKATDVQLILNTKGMGCVVLWKLTTYEG